MSDLIERLEELKAACESERGTAKYIQHDTLARLGLLTWDHIDEIIAGLSALKTVRGIEGLAKGSMIEIWGPTPENDRWNVNIMSIGGPLESTLSLAVDAAVGASETRERSESDADE